MQKAIISLLFLFLGTFSYPIEAGLPDFKAGSVILDDETNSAFKHWILKIFSVAGLKGYHPHIYIIANSEVNAAAALGGDIFIFSEFLINCDNAGQFLGVMAHEVGHIAGGHVSRSDAASHQAMVPAAAALLLGGALALATGDPTPLTAGLAGGSHLFERGMLKFSRTQESAADQAGLSYLEKLGWPPEGLAEFLDKISKLQGSTLKMDPYAVTHPLTPDRIEAVHAHLQKHPRTKRAVPPEIEATFQRIKAKMMAFLSPQKALAAYKEGDPSLPARYARAIALYRQGQFAQSLNHIEALIKSYPKDPYFHELKGQVLFEKGDVEATVPALQIAYKLQPHSPLITIMLAHALVESKSTPGGIDQAIKLLSPLTQKHPKDYPMAWRLLGTAYGKSGKMGEAALALAEEALLSENHQLAKSQANRAKSLLKCNPKALRRVEDLLKQIK